MKAYVLHGINDLRYEDVDMPCADEGHVIVKVMAAGVCGSDIPRIFETGTYHFPTIPGHEFAGMVCQTDAGNKHLLNRRVGVFPLIPCKTCASCRRGYYEMCADYGYLGSRTDGGFAEYVQVPVWNLIELPEEVRYEEAAMLEPMAVALHALRQVHIKDKESIAIWGMGPIGLLFAQWARICGIERIFVLGNKEGQRKLAEDLGFREYCDTRREDSVAWLMEKTEGQGTGITVDGVGSSRVLSECILGAAPGGSVLVMGNPKGDVCLEKNVYWKILRKQLTVRGTWNSSFGDGNKNDWRDAVNALAKREIQANPLITHRLLFTELETGLLLMRDKKEFFCKVMISR